MFGFAFNQILAAGMFLAAAGLGLPEVIKLGKTLLGKVSLPKVSTAASGGSKTPTLIEATHAADTLQRWYGCRCSEAQTKLQEALRHLLDPVVNPPAPPVDTEAARLLTELLAARPNQE